MAKLTLVALGTLPGVVILALALWVPRSRLWLFPVWISIALVVVPIWVLPSVKERFALETFDGVIWYYGGPVILLAVVVEQVLVRSK